MKKIILFFIIFLSVLPCLCENIIITAEKTFAESKNNAYNFQWAGNGHKGDFEYSIYKANPADNSAGALVIKEKTSENSISVSADVLKPGETYYLKVFSENIHSYIWHEKYFETVGNFQAKVPRSFFMEPKKEKMPKDYKDFYYAPFRFSNEMFAEKGDIYNPDLALLSAVASGCAYSRDYTNTEKSCEYLNDFLSYLCFENIEYYNAEKLPDTIETGEKGLFAICHRKIFLKGKYYNLIGIINRGTVLGEWYGNFNIGTGNIHQGFEISAREVLNALDIYTEKYSLTDREENKFWICGHSRGAAVANLLSKYLESKSYAKKDNIYGYTVACPNVYIGKEEKANVFNIINSGDFVPAIPYWDMWNKYGTNIYSENMSKETLAEAENIFYKTAQREYAGYSVKNIKTIKKELTKIAPTADAYYNIKFNKSAKDGGRSAFDVCNLICNLIINPTFRDYLAIPNEFNNIFAIIGVTNFNHPKIIISHSTEYYYSLTEAYNHSLNNKKINKLTETYYL